MYDARMLSTRWLCFAAALGALFTSCRSDRGPAAPPDTAIPPPNADVIAGAPDRFLLIGTILTPDQVIEERVLVEGAKITCVAAGADCAMRPGAAGTTIIDTRGVIALGMIDTHNHILFDIDGAAHAVARRLPDR